MEPNSSPVAEPQPNGAGYWMHVPAEHKAAFDGLMKLMVSWAEEGDEEDYSAEEWEVITHIRKGDWWKPSP